MAVTDIDERKLEAFIGLVATEIGAAANAALVSIGDELGLFRAMADGQAVSSAELAARTGTQERYVREWLAAQAASGFLELGEDGYVLPPEHALVLADESSPFLMTPSFQAANAAVAARERLAERFVDGEGLGWHEHHHDLFEGTERFFRPGYNAHLIAEWIPSLDGVEERLREGIRVADIGCGHGVSTILMAQAFPESTFVGSDYHEGSIEAARRAAERAHVSDRVTFEVAGAKDFGGGPFDLVCVFDALHDMGDPVGAARHVGSQLADGGTWLVVEPMAADTVEENLNPVGRVFYAGSTMLCTPASLSQEVGLALGAQAGQQRLTEVLNEGGFSHVRRSAETPFNLVLEVRR